MLSRSRAAGAVEDEPSNAPCRRDFGPLLVRCGRVPRSHTRLAARATRFPFRSSISAGFSLCSCRRPRACSQAIVPPEVPRRDVSSRSRLRPRGRHDASVRAHHSSACSEAHCLAGDIGDRTLETSPFETHSLSEWAIGSSPRTRASRGQSS